MERLDATAPRALRLALAQQPTSAGKILFAWSLVAGPAMSRAVTASWDSGTLRLVPHSETWKREVRRARVELLARLAGLLGPGVVKSLDISGQPESRSR